MSGTANGSFSRYGSDAVTFKVFNLDVGAVGAKR